MNQFEIPFFNISMAKDIDEKMESKGIDYIQLKSDEKTVSKELFTCVYLACGVDGLALSWCAEIPHFKNLETISSSKNNREKVPENVIRNVKKMAFDNKGRVFSAEHIGIYLKRPSEKTVKCFQINPFCACLDFDVYEINSLSEDSEFSSELFYDMCDSKLMSGRHEVKSKTASVELDFDVETKASWKSAVQDEFWYGEFFIPWKELKCDSCPDNLSEIDLQFYRYSNGNYYSLNGDFKKYNYNFLHFAKGVFLK